MEETTIKKNSFCSLWEEAHDSLLKSMSCPMNIGKNHKNKVRPNQIVMGDTKKEMMSNVCYNTSGLRSNDLQIINCGIVRNGKYKIVTNSNRSIDSTFIKSSISLLESSDVQRHCQEGKLIHPNPADLIEESKNNGLKQKSEYIAQSESQNELSCLVSNQNNPLVEVPMEHECSNKYESYSKEKSGEQQASCGTNINRVVIKQEKSCQYKCEAQLKFEKFALDKSKRFSTDELNDDFSGINSVISISSAEQLNIKLENSPNCSKSSTDIDKDDINSLCPINSAKNPNENISSKEITQGHFTPPKDSDNKEPFSIISPNIKEYEEITLDQFEILCAEYRTKKHLSQEDGTSQQMSNKTYDGKNCQDPNKLSREYTAKEDSINSENTVLDLELEYSLQSEVKTRCKSPTTKQQTPSNVMNEPPGFDLPKNFKNIIVSNRLKKICYSNDENQISNILHPILVESFSLNTDGSATSLNLENVEVDEKNLGFSSTELLNEKPNLNNIRQSVGFSYSELDGSIINDNSTNSTLLSNFGSFRFVKPLNAESSVSNENKCQTQSQHWNFVFTDSKVFNREEDFTVDSLESCVDKKSQKVELAAEKYELVQLNQNSSRDNLNNYHELQKSKVEKSTSAVCSVRPNSIAGSSCVSSHHNFKTKVLSKDNKIMDLYSDIEHGLASLSLSSPSSKKENTLKEIYSVTMDSAVPDDSLLKCEAGKVFCNESPSLEVCAQNCDGKPQGNLEVSFSEKNGAVTLNTEAKSKDYKIICDVQEIAINHVEKMTEKEKVISAVHVEINKSESKFKTDSNKTTEKSVSEDQDNLDPRLFTTTKKGGKEVVYNDHSIGILLTSQSNKESKALSEENKFSSYISEGTSYIEGADHYDRVLVENVETLSVERTSSVEAGKLLSSKISNKNSKIKLEDLKVAINPVEMDKENITSPLSKNLVKSGMTEILAEKPGYNFADTEREQTVHQGQKCLKINQEKGENLTNCKRFLTDTKKRGKEVDYNEHSVSILVSSQSNNGSKALSEEKDFFTNKKKDKVKHTSFSTETNILSRTDTCILKESNNKMDNRTGKCKVVHSENSHIRNIVSLERKTVEYIDTITTGKEERDRIDGIDFLSFETEQDMMDFMKLEFKSKCFLNDKETSCGSDKFSSNLTAIIPTKTDDITKIKGWRNKSFVGKNNQVRKDEGKHETEKKTKVDKRTMKTPSVGKTTPEKKLRDQLDTIYAKKLAEDSVLHDLEKKVSESKDNTVSVFESSILEDYLKTNTGLNISYEIPTLCAADTFPVVKRDIFLEATKSFRTTNNNIVSIKGNSSRSYKPKTLAEKRVMLEMDMLEGEQKIDNKCSEPVKENVITTPKELKKSRRPARANSLGKPKFDFNPNHKYVWVQGRPIRVVGNKYDLFKKKKFPGVVSKEENIPDFRKPLKLQNLSDVKDELSLLKVNNEPKEDLEISLCVEVINPEPIDEKTGGGIEPIQGTDFSNKQDSIKLCVNFKENLLERHRPHYSLIPAHEKDEATLKNEIIPLKCIKSDICPENIPVINRCQNNCRSNNENICNRSNTFSLGMVLHIGVNRPLSKEAMKNFSLLQTNDDVIDERMAHIASAAVQAPCSFRSKNLKVSRYVVPVVCKDLIDIAQVNLSRCANSLDPVSSYDVTSFLNKINEFEISSTSVEPDPEVKSIVDGMINYVERKLCFSPIPYDPDAPETRVDEKVGKKKCREKSGPTSNVERELRRLINVSIIDLSNETASGDDQENHCTKDFCSKGCVCSSLEGKLPLSHCGKSPCIFGCICPDKFMESEKYIVYNNNEKQQLAKEEKTWHQTVIRKKNKDIQVMVGSDRIKRKKKLPQKYRNHVVLFGKEVISPEASPEEIRLRRSEYSKSIKRKILQKQIKKAEEAVITEDVYLTKRDVEVKVAQEEIEPSSLEHFSPKQQPKTPVKKEDTIKRNSMDRILSYCSGDPVKEETKSLADVLIWCMNHNIYNCVCHGWVCDLRSNVILWKSSRNSKYLNVREMSTIILKAYRGLGKAQIYDLDKFCARTFGAPVNYVARNKSRVFSTKRNYEIKTSYLASSNAYYKLSNILKECVVLYNREKKDSISDDCVWSLVGLSEGKLEDITDIIPEKDMQDLSIRLRLISTSLPIVPFDSRWWVIELENNFDHLLIATDTGSTSYGMIAETVRHAQTRQSTVCLPFLWRKDHKYGNQFGAYAINKLSNVICLGPYALNENHMLMAYRNIKGKVFNVPFTNSYKAASNPRMHIKGYWCYIKPKGDLENTLSQGGEEVKNDVIHIKAKYGKQRFLNLGSENGKENNSNSLDCVVVEDSESEEERDFIEINSCPLSSEVNINVCPLPLNGDFDDTEETQVDVEDLETTNENSPTDTPHPLTEISEKVDFQLSNISHTNKRKRLNSTEIEITKKKGKDKRNKESDTLVLCKNSTEDILAESSTDQSPSLKEETKITENIVTGSSEYGLLCLTAGVGYLRVSNFTSKKLLVQNPLHPDSFHTFEDLDDAGRWLNRYMKQRMTFEPENLKLEWIIVKPGIWKYTSPFNPQILQKSYIVRKEGVSKSGDLIQSDETISRFSKTSLVSLVNQFLDRRASSPSVPDPVIEALLKDNVTKQPSSQPSILKKRTRKRKLVEINEFSERSIEGRRNSKYAKVMKLKSLSLRESNKSQPSSEHRKCKETEAKETLKKSRNEIEFLKLNPELSVIQIKKSSSSKSIKDSSKWSGAQISVCKKMSEYPQIKLKQPPSIKRSFSEDINKVKKERSGNISEEEGVKKLKKSGESPCISDEKVDISCEQAGQESSKKVMVTLEMVIPDKVTVEVDKDKMSDNQHKLGQTCSDSSVNVKTYNTSRNSGVTEAMGITKVEFVEIALDKNIPPCDARTLNKPPNSKDLKDEVEAANTYVKSLFCKKANKSDTNLSEESSNSMPKTETSPTSKVPAVRTLQSTEISNPMIKGDSQKFNSYTHKGKIAGEVFLGDKKLFTIPFIAMESKLVHFK